MPSPDLIAASQSERTEASVRAARANVNAAILRGQLKEIVVDLNEVIRLLESDPMHVQCTLRDAEFAARCLNDALQLAREQGL